MTDVSTARPGPDRFLIGIVVGAVALIVIGIAAVVLLGRSAPPPDPGSPVGVVQAYIEAVRSGEQEAARALLSQSARQQLDRNREVFPRYPGAPSVERRVLIQPVSQSADRAEVKVTITTFSARSDPFSSNTYSREIQVFLVREGAGWRINQPIEPFVFLA